MKNSRNAALNGGRGSGQTVRRVTELYEAKIADLKANFDYFIEGKDLEIKTLGERCNQLLKDKGNLTDTVRALEAAREDFIKDNAKLKQQIEKMKCCYNCFYDCEDCNSKNKDCDKCPCGTCVKHNHWELRR